MTLAYNMYRAAEAAAAKAAAEAVAKAAAEARNEGISLGITQGAYQKAVETAKSMRFRSISIDVIAECTGLSIEEIEKL